MTTIFMPPSIERLTIDELMLPDVNSHINLFGMHVRTVSAQWAYPAHEHPQYELNYVLDGTQLLTVGGKQHIQQTGELCLIRPGDTHSSMSTGLASFTYFCLHFDIDDSLFLSLLSRMKQTKFDASSSISQRIHPMLLRLIALTEDHTLKTTIRRMRLQATVFELFALLWECLSEEADQLHGADYDRMELAHRIRSRLHGLVNQQFRQGETVEEHYGIDDVAADLGISTSHCNRVFRQTFTVSPRAYLSQLVLDKAKQLLADERLSVQQISIMLGYRDLAHFSRQFKRWTGSAPSTYRAELLTSPQRSEHSATAQLLLDKDR